MVIDRKYKILAVNPCSGKIHTEDDSVLFALVVHEPHFSAGLYFAIL